MKQYARVQKIQGNINFASNDAEQEKYLQKISPIKSVELCRDNVKNNVSRGKVLKITAVLEYNLEW